MGLSDDMVARMRVCAPLLGELAATELLRVLDALSAEREASAALRAELARTVAALAHEREGAEALDRALTEQATRADREAARADRAERAIAGLCRQLRDVVEEVDVVGTTPLSIDEIMSGEPADLVRRLREDLCGERDEVREAASALPETRRERDAARAAVRIVSADRDAAESRARALAAQVEGLRTLVARVDAAAATNSPFQVTMSTSRVLDAVRALAAPAPEPAGDEAQTLAAQRGTKETGRCARCGASCLPGYTPKGWCPRCVGTGPDAQTKETDR